MEPLPLEAAPSPSPRPGRRWKGLIKVGYACNNHCTFCHTLDLRDVDGTGALVMRKIDRARQLGYGMIVLSGGEVTMRKELLLWAARSASLGMDFGLVTNGRMLAYPELVAKLLRLRLRYVYMSLHGGEARVHNSLVRANAFEETYGAIRNLVGHGLDLTVNTVVTKQNVAHLRGVVDLLAPLDGLTLKFSMVQPKGGGAADHAFQSLVPDVAEAAERIGEAIHHGLTRGAEAGHGPRYAHDGVPLCLLPGLEDLYDDLQTHGFASMTEAFEPDFFPVDDADKVQPPVCQGCALAGPCPGLYRSYHQLRGEGALRPVRAGARSNSFTWTPDRTLKKPEGGGCPIYDSPLPYHLGRHLLVDGGDHVIVHHTASRDFSEPEIARVKRDLGQVYLDRSDKPAPDDFPRDLQKLALAPICLPCDKRERCTGTYLTVDEELFGPADEAVRAHVRAIALLGGRVIDIGCGDGRYGDLWEEPARAGTLRYLGVEPDADRATRLAARWPWATVRSGPIEALSDEDLADPIACLLVLRSWNHLADPARALAPLVERLAPGGLLLVVDNVAFGLVRSSTQQRRAERSAAGFEHHRNDDSTAALTALALLPLDPIEHLPVAREGSNQWLLALRRQQ
ncbi:MAG: radical SAM protein [Myxococcales bacterium]|nr:radical SAM protein [Myxococcales bacterium]